MSFLGAGVRELSLALSLLLTGLYVTCQWYVVLLLFPRKLFIVFCHHPALMMSARLTTKQRESNCQAWKSATHNTNPPPELPTLVIILSLSSLSSDFVVGRVLGIVLSLERAPNLQHRLRLLLHVRHDRMAHTALFATIGLH